MALLAMALGLAGGCGSDGECFLDAGLPCSVCESVTEPAALQIGGYNGQTTFVELDDGDDMALVRGPGGGYFLWVSIRAWGVYPGEAGPAGNAAYPVSSIQAEWQGSVVARSPRMKVSLTATDTGAEALGFFVVVDGSSYPIELIDQLVTIRGEITDVCGNTATDTLDVVVVDQ